MGWGGVGGRICSLNKPVGFVLTLCLHLMFLRTMQEVYMFLNNTFAGVLKGFFFLSFSCLKNWGSDH